MQAVRLGLGLAAAATLSVMLLMAGAFLVIHNGPQPNCTIIPNLPQHDCFRPGEERREFSLYYLTPHGVRSLVWFRLPPR